MLDWYDEVQDFDPAGVKTFGLGQNTGVIGHYSQVGCCLHFVETLVAVIVIL